ncbi:MAG: DUF3179 domain-containing protein, partial [Calditrichaeota bacterium]
GRKHGRQFFLRVPGSGILRAKPQRYVALALWPNTPFSQVSRGLSAFRKMRLFGHIPLSWRGLFGKVRRIKWMIRPGIFVLKSMISPLKHRSPRCLLAWWLALIVWLPGCHSTGIDAPRESTRGSKPKITGFFALPTVAVPGSEVQVTVQAQDDDGDPLHYLWKASGGTFSGSGPTVTWHAPVQPQDSLYRVAVQVSDQKDGSASAFLDLPVDFSDSQENCSVPCDQIIRVGPPRCEDCIGMPSIPALFSPEFVAADDPGAAYLTDETPVIGLVSGQDIRAYPVLILNRHEIVNDVFAGRRIAVTYCPFTASPLIFDRDEGVGTGMDFGVSGFLYNANLVMYDLQGQTLWSQMRFEAVKGRFLARKLTTLPGFFMQWNLWKKLFPTTRVISSATGHNKNYAYDEYAGYNTSPYIWAPVHHKDHRLPPKARVFGVILEGEQKAYPWDALGEMGILQDRVGGQSILIAWYSPGRFVTAFFPKTSKGEARFSLVRSEAASPFYLQDDLTGTLWDLTGRAVDGPLKGESLTVVQPAYSAFWFAWSAIWPDTRLYSGGAGSD